MRGGSPPYLAPRFTILTAARGTPVRGARFDEIEGDVWTVPAVRMKGSKEKMSGSLIPLSTAAMEVAERCRELRRNDFLFLAPIANKGTSDVAIRMRRHTGSREPHSHTSLGTRPSDPMRAPICSTGGAPCGREFHFKGLHP